MEGTRWGQAYGPSAHFRLHKESALVRGHEHEEEEHGSGVAEMAAGRRAPTWAVGSGGHWEEEIVTALPILGLLRAIWSHGPKACKMYV